MKTLNVAISDIEFNKFGLKEEKLSFSDLLELVSKELTRMNLSKSVELAEKYGLSNMSLEEINSEVRAVRNNAKSNH
ncbi:MAG: hypothetical protein KKE39_12785 [Bacteroidetes bacterium]|nr:hypothetical protein [Bacteroidota bacterium]MBU1371924.1 hypothetical protein [Bacteroidota bacterium]MBU1483526.1 hypothetical protein [Bacteroidota bacterium]MBU1759776.1 hypothetical protein [Bacteroidota bacterium]MBU2269235.1 hypothetical protein [Bacteroidota bacterium]